MLWGKSNKHFKKSLIKLSICLLFALVPTLLLFPGTGVPALAAGGLNISTSYPGITAKAGENLDFDIRVENSSAAGQNVELHVKSIPEGWDGYFTGMGKPIHKVYVKNNDYTSVDFNVKIPFEAVEGSYKITLSANAGGYSIDELELDIRLSEKDMAGSKFTTRYPELQGPSSAVFKFQVDLANNSSKEQSYSFGAQAPRGWEVSFSPSYENKQIASLSLEPGKSQGLDVEIKPPMNVKAEKYIIPITAVSADETLKAEISITITGTYDIKMTTPSGRLNVDAYAGKESPVTINIVNAGSADLGGVSLSSWQPDNWSVRFEPESLDLLAAGETREVKAYIKPAPNSIAGDYVVSLMASAPETRGESEFRVTVKTPTGWGIVGVVIILLLVGGLYRIFKVYGRR
jgi:uncharacterized membrane protein